MRFTLRGARLVDAHMDLAEGEITIGGAHIEQLGEGDTAPGRGGGADDPDARSLSHEERRAPCTAAR